MHRNVPYEFTVFSKTTLIYRLTSTGDVPLFHTQSGSDTTMAQLGRSKPASVGLCVACSPRSTECQMKCISTGSSSNSLGLCLAGPYALRPKKIYSKRNSIIGTVMQ